MDTVVQAAPVRRRGTGRAAPQGCPSYSACFSFFFVARGPVFCEEAIAKALRESPLLATDPAAALTSAIAGAEAAWLAECLTSKSGEGCTALIVLVKGTSLWVANVGDSEAVLAIDGVPRVLTEVHNAARNPDERARVVAEGGTLMADGRLCHPQLPSRMFSIAVSRSLGDYTFKGEEYTNGKPSGLVARPFICHVELTDDAQFVILACDGLWDVMTYADAVGFVVRRLRQAVERSSIAQALVERAYAMGSQDNITAIIVFL